MTIQENKNCEQRIQKISTPIYGLDVVKDGSKVIDDDACIEFWDKQQPKKRDPDMCKPHIEGARRVYKMITAECGTPSGGMRKRRTSRRTKRKIKSSNKNKRTKRKRKRNTSKKSKRTRTRTRTRRH